MGTAASVESHEDFSTIEKYMLTDPKEVLINSARNGKPVELALVIQQGMDPNETESHVSSLRALHFASRHGHLQCVVTLLDLGANVNAEDKRGWQPIHEAALHGRAECLTALLKNGANVNAIAYNGNGPSTPLQYAARHGHLKCVRLLLRAGADWRIGNEFGETPLHCTAMRGHVECMMALLYAGADINTETRDGLTAAYYSAVCGHALHLKELIKHGIDINKRYREPGRTLLHYAAESVRPKVLLALLESGADTDIPAGPRRLSPLHLAARHGHREIVDLLLQYGAAIEARSLNGLTPLHHAARCGQSDAGAVLIKHGANVNAKSDDTKETPLHMCVPRLDRAFTDLLLKNQADPFIRDKAGKRAVDTVPQNDDMKKKLKAAMTAETVSQFYRSLEELNKGYLN